MMPAPPLPDAEFLEKMLRMGPELVVGVQRALERLDAEERAGNPLIEDIRGWRAHYLAILSHIEKSTPQQKEAALAQAEREHIKTAEQYVGALSPRARQFLLAHVGPSPINWEEGEAAAVAHEVKHMFEIVGYEGQNRAQRRARRSRR